jgi:hypothetical protein
VPTLTAAAEIPTPPALMASTSAVRLPLPESTWATPAVPTRRPEAKVAAMVPLGPASDVVTPGPALVIVIGDPPSTVRAPSMPVVAGPPAVSDRSAAALPPVTARPAALPSWVIVSVSHPLPSTAALRSPPEDCVTAVASCAGV